MKKILFALCAVAALVSCNNNEIVNLDQEAISFGSAFVNNSTKAEDTFTIDLARLQNEGFKVWATTQRPASSEVVSLLAEEPVTYSGGAWGYAVANTQYWIPGNTYNFTALVNADVATNDVEDGHPVQFVYDVTTQKDLLYATRTCTGQATGSNTSVEFTFEHLLSKAYLTVDLTDMSQNNDKYTYLVENVQINDVFKVATYDIAGDVWTKSSSYNCELGDVDGADFLAAGATYTSDYARLVVPSTYTNAAGTPFGITCTISTLYDEQLINVQNYSTSAGFSHTFEKGHVYNFVLKLGNPGDEIDFTVLDVTDWDPDHNGNGSDDDDVEL